MGNSAGLLIGACSGWLAAKLIMFIHARRTEKLVIEDFVSIGLIAASYGLAQLVTAYGFLAVFAAGLSFARMERSEFRKRQGDRDEAFYPALIRFSTQLERIGEVAAVVFVGYVAGRLPFSANALIFSLVLFLVIRPLAVGACFGWRRPHFETAILSWFGIRGIGSIYYLYYSLNNGLGGEFAEVVFNVVMQTIVLSVFVHGISATPIMRFYDRRQTLRN